MKIFKKNQIIIYVIALVLMTVGYLNYTNRTKKLDSIETSVETKSENLNNTNSDEIGDAKLVSSNDIASNSSNDNENIIEENLDTSKRTEENIENGEKEEQNKTEETNGEINKEEVEDDYFDKSKLERDTIYSQMIETYENILNSENATETQKQAATDEIKKINDTKNSIMICENLIKTKGFEKSVIFVNNLSISIIIGKEEITAEEVAKVQNIISREMGAAIENIHISTK